MRSTDLIAKLRLDSTPFDQSLKSAQTQLQSVSRVAGAVPGKNIFGSMAADAANLVPALSSVPLGIAAVGAAMAGAGAAARRAGVEFEASLAKIATLGAGAKAALGDTREAILDTFTSVPVTGAVVDLAEANYLLQSSGRSAEEAITDLRTAAEASVAGYTGVTTAVDGLTSVTGAWAESAITTARASDVLFASVNFGKASFEDIAQSIGLVAPIAASAGVRFEEVAAATAVLSNQGIRTSSIMEGLRSAIVNIQKPTEAFRRDYADLAREFGAGRLAQDGLIKFLRDFDTASGGSRNALNALFSDVTGLTAALGLLKNGGDDASAALKSMEGAAGATASALAEVNGTAKAQEQLIRNQLAGVWTNFGSLLSTTTLPILESIGRALNAMQGKAGFVQTDLARFLGGDGVTQTKQELQALIDLYDQFADAPTDVLAGASTVQLAQLRYRLSQRAPEPFAGREQARQGLLARIPEELASRAAAEAAERTTQQAAEARAQAKAVELAEDQLERDRRERARLQAETAKRERDQAARELEQQRARIVEDAAQLVTRLEASAVDALQGAAGALQLTMKRTLDEGAKLIASGALSPEASASLTAQLDVFKRLQQQLIVTEQEAVRTKATLDAALSTDALPASEIIAARERELLIILEGTTNLLARKKIEEQLNALAAARGDTTANVFALPGTGADTLDDQIAQMGDLAQSIATVGDQLGFLPRRTVDALRGIGALVEQGSKIAATWGRLGTLGKIGVGVGIAGGVASLAASVLGPSPEERAQRDAIKQNTEALRRLSENVGDLADSAITGVQFAGARRGFSRVLEENGGGFPGDRVLRENGGLRGLIASRGGITVSQLDDAIKATGLTLTNSVQSMRQLLEFFAKAETDGYVDSFTGSLQRFEDTLRADGVTDPFEIFRRRIAVYTDPKTGFPALAEAFKDLDLSTVEGRTEARTRARTIFDDIVAGRLPIEQFGNLSIPEGRKAVLDVISSIFDLDKSDAAGTGGFNQTRTITEVTGNRLAGLFSTANQYLRTIADDVASLRATFVMPAPVRIAPPSVESIVGRSGESAISFGPGSITINVTLDSGLLGDGATQALAAGEAIGTKLSAQFIDAIDQALQERVARKRMIYGNARLS